jgi:acetyl esterase/lipase
MSIVNLDPELRPTLEAYLGTGRTFDADGLRLIREEMRARFAATPPVIPPTVRVEDVTIPGPDGDTELLLCVDCYAGLVWTAAHAHELGIDPERIAVGGPSAGGGLAAGTALLARDRRGPRVAFQLLFEPMLDDRAITPSSNAYEDSVVWDRNANRFGWNALLGDRAGTDAVSHYAAPARATDVDGLPPAFVDVGEIETFRDECIVYAQRLMMAGVSTELHVYRGAVHGFDLMAPDSTVARVAWGLRWAALARAFGLRQPRFSLD